eukprot:scaffold294459_cov33-Tisochrysis_lutea.AAC.4
MSAKSRETAWPSVEAKRWCLNELCTQSTAVSWLGPSASRVVHCTSARTSAWVRSAAISSRRAPSAM